MVALVTHTKFVSDGGTSSSLNTTGANFIALFYTFYNGGDYPLITDNKGNTYYNFSRQNAFSPALASEMRFTKQVISGTGHTFTVAKSNTYPDLPLLGMTLFVQAFSGILAGSDSNPNFFSVPWYSDGGNNCPPPYVTNTTLSCNPGSAGGTNGQVIIMGWGNTDPNHTTVITATDGLSGTPSFTTTDSIKFHESGQDTFNAGMAYYIQPTQTSTSITQTWVDNTDFSSGGSWGVMSSGVFLPGAPAPPMSSTKRAKVKWF